MLHNCLLGCRPDRSNLEMRERPAREAKLPEAIPHGFDAVGARENEPVVAPDIFQSLVKWPVRLRLADLNEGDLDYRCAQTAQARGKAAGLVMGTSDKNPGAGEGMVFVGLHGSGVRSQVLGLRRQVFLRPET